MREVIRRQHKALSTEESYIGWLRRYMKALRKMPEGLSSEKKLELFLTDLARHRDVSASTQNQAFNAEPVSSLSTHLQSRHPNARPRPVPSVRKQPDASSCF